MDYKQLSLVLFAFVCQIQIAFPSSTHHLCPKDESISLLKFKETLIVDPTYFLYDYMCNYDGQKYYAKTSSWNMSRDCCLWDGVNCDEMTGHVTELDLSCSMLVGAIDSNSTLFHLSHLQSLNLSRNDFSTSPISPKFGTFSRLTRLDLSGSQFSGLIPSEITHLSKLQSLRLPASVEGSLRLAARDFNLLLRNLTQLRELDLSEVSISSSIPENLSSHITTLRLDNTGLHGILPHQIFHLPNLKEVDLSGNVELSASFPKMNQWNSSTSLRDLKLSGVNFSGNFLPQESLGYLTSLQVLELKYCSLSGRIPESLSNATRLESLDLENNNHLQGQIPLSLGYLTSLHSLNLDSCNLSGLIPKNLWNLTHLESLYLPNNHLEGSLPLFTSGLQNLQSLSLTRNSLSGAIPSWIFSLPSLSYLYLNFNHFSGHLEDFKYNEALINLNLEGNQVQGTLPKSIQNLVNLIELDFTSNNLSGDVDVGLFSNLQELSVLDISHNNISLTHKNKSKSTFPESLSYLGLSGCNVKELDFLRSVKQLYLLDLSYNKIQGGIPDWIWSNWKLSMSNLNLSHNMLTTIHHIPLLKLTSIDLRSNFLQGSLPVPPPSVQFFFISNNNLSGEIPSSVCNLTSLIVLDLARNNLKGEIPQCLGNTSQFLEVLDMQQNSLSGNLPTTFSFENSLRSLNLHGNELEGKIPRSLANIVSLEVLDLGNNHLNDTFPVWLGTLPELQVLSLRSNKLHGPIRTSKIKNLFPQLRILDLSSNSFTEELPASVFRHLKALKRIDQTMKAPRDETDRYYQDSVIVVTKGLALQVVRILSLYTTIDLSNNKFEGPIPNVLGDLISLRVLNLSHNGLQGHIPQSLGNLSVVESLDVSANQLSGEIPQQLASLTYLAFLNLSHNHLQGCIPRGHQLATFDNRSYEGNNGLRGFPISKDCEGQQRPKTDNATVLQDEESNSTTFLSELTWEVVLMGYGFGLLIGFSIAYFMLSARNSNWLSRITEELEYKITMRRQVRSKKK